MKLILASNSPRRKEILTNEGFSFFVVPSNYEEKTERLLPIDLAKTFAYNKAKDVFSSFENNDDILVLGADTIVVLDNTVLGKPKDFEQAFKMLKSLSNREHQVITGYSLLGKDIEINGYDTSFVNFNNLSDEYITEYINTKKPFDKAGGYGIQDGFNLCKNYSGSYFNIMGLPIEKIKIELKTHNISL